MVNPNVEFISLTSLRAEAIGEPGQRTFRIVAESGDSAAVIWLEKEQLLQLVMAITQLLATEPESGENDSGPEVKIPHTHLEFKATELVLGHEATSGRFIIDAKDVESMEGDPPMIRLWSLRSQLSDFAEESLRVCAAGRPICPLCGSPIDASGHRCPRSNGHGLLDLKDL